MLKNIPNEIIKILNILEQNNYQAYLVGGCVRDLLLNKIPKDYDICTSAKPEEVKKIFAKVVSTGEKHGTVTVLINNYPIEVTTMRKDGIYKDNRHPEEIFYTNNLEEDLARRDFTINSIAMDIKGNIYDYHNGLNDLNNKLIKAVRNPCDRFEEDALRMMRLIRFVCQLDFNIDYKTIEAVKNNNSLIQNISIERTREELNYILVSNKPSDGIRMLYQYGLLRYIIPELCICVGFDQCNPFHNKDIFEHTMTVLENIPNNLILRLSALLHDISKPETFSLDENNIAHFYKHHIKGADLAEIILKRMKYDNETINKVKNLIFYHMDRYENLSYAGVKRFINRVGKENVYDLFELQIADRKGCKDLHFNDILDLKNKVQEVLSRKEPLTIKNLSINGHDLIELGIKPGKEMGLILNNLLELVIEEPRLNTKEQLINLAKDKG